MISREDAAAGNGSQVGDLRRYSNQPYENSNNNKRQRHAGPDGGMNIQDARSSFGGGLDAGQAMSVSHLANLRAAAGFMGNNLAPPSSFSSSLSNNNFLGNYIDQRLFETAKQQLRQGADISMISNLFQSPAIPAGNTDFAFSPTISIPIARSMLNSHPVASSLAMNSADLDSSSQGMSPLLSAVALLQGRQGLLDSLAAQQQPHWSSQGMQQSVEQAVHTALANARQQEQMQQMQQQASLTQEYLQRYAADRTAAAAASFNDSLVVHPQAKSKKPKSSKKISDGVPIAIAEDRCKLNDQQVFLREQIEAYPATEDDLTSHTRGRNKPIVLGQIGLRCKHCNHLPPSQRGKGSTYFPSTLMGIYQAAQNMSVEHLQSGICTEMPPDVRNRFLTFTLTKPGASVAGKRYWADAGKQVGLVDTEHGIRFAKDEKKPPETEETSEPSSKSSVEE